MTYKPPMVITSHPAVAECDSGDAVGIDCGHNVLLKDGWAFTQGRLAGCQIGSFHTVIAFCLADPKKEVTNRACSWFRRSSAPHGRTYFKFAATSSKSPIRKKTNSRTSLIEGRIPKKMRD